MRWPRPFCESSANRDSPRSYPPTRAPKLRNSTGPSFSRNGRIFYARSRVPLVHDFVIRAYQRLPAPLRNVAATLQGYRLRAWRYGPESERLIGEALERETWSADRWLSWQQERLS